LPTATMGIIAEVVKAVEWFGAACYTAVVGGGEIRAERRRTAWRSAAARRRCMVFEARFAFLQDYFHLARQHSCF
jgi:hypothetical protein